MHDGGDKLLSTTLLRKARSEESRAIVLLCAAMRDSAFSSCASSGGKPGSLHTNAVAVMELEGWSSARVARRESYFSSLPASSKAALAHGSLANWIRRVRVMAVLTLSGDGSWSD